MKPRELAALSNPRVYPDGSLSFAVERVDGQRFEISCSQDQLTDIFQFLASLARAASELAATEVTQERPQVSPIQTDGVGFGVSDDASQALLIFRIGGFHLGFSMPNSALAEFGHKIGQTAQALSAEGKPT